MNLIDNILMFFKRKNKTKLKKAPLSFAIISGGGKIMAGNSSKQ